MKTLTTPFAAVAWLCCIPLSSADTIVLKNGDKLEGRVLREVDGNYVLEVKISETIRDEKTIPKSDVKYIDKEQEDLKAFEKLETLLPTPELLSIVEYESRVEKIEDFIKAYPKSTQVSKAKKMLETISEELVVIRGGGIKFGEEIVSAQDYMSNAYELDSAIAGKRIKEAVGRRDFIGALRSFSKYEENFSKAAGRVEIVALIKQVLSVYRTSIDEGLASFDSRMEKRKSGLASMAADDRAQTERALAEQEERIAARFAQEKEAREPWITPDVLHKESLDEARRQVESEINRLESPNRTEEIDTPVAESYRVAWGKAGSGTEEEKTAAISEARTNGVPEAYLGKLREHAGIAAP